MKNKKDKNKPQQTQVCSRDHEYSGSGPCPVCWPGYYKKKQGTKKMK